MKILNGKKDIVKDIKTITLLSLPVIIENILQVLLGTVDTFFASMLDENAIAGIGVTNLINNIFIAFFTAIGVGTTTIISRSIGAGRKEEANETIKQAIMLTTIISALIGVISYIFTIPFLKLLGAQNEMLEYAIPYYKLTVVPCVFLALSLILSSSLRSAKDTKSPMIATVIANICNIVLNYVLMFGIGDFSGLGIVGAAISTTVSRMIVVIILLIKLIKGNMVLKLSIFEKWRLNKKIMYSITKIGIPAGIEKLIMRFGQLSYGKMIISIGPSAYIAHNIAGTIENYSYLPALGLGVGAAALVGNCLGNKEFKKAKRFGVLANVLSTVLMIIMGIIFYIGAPCFAGAFTDDVEIKKLVVSVLRIVAFMQPALSVTIVISSALQGAGDTKFPMYTTILGIWGIRVCFGYLFAIRYNLGLVGIWLAYALDISIRAVLIFIRYMKGKWEKIEI